MEYPAQEGKKLFTEEEFEAFLKELPKGARWINYYIETEINDTQKVQYKGYWNEEKTEILGIGEIKFEDGSLF